MSPDPFPDQMLAAPALIAYVIVKAWRPLAADVLCVVIAGVLLAVTARLIVSVEKWIDRRVLAHRWARERRAFEAVVAGEFDDGPFAADEPTQEPPDVVQLGPATPPPAHVVRRRRVAGVRIPVRPRRRRSLTSSTTDRRHHS